MRHRDVGRWVRRLASAAEQLPGDATDFELLDAVEVLHRTRAELDLERARLLAELWSRRRGSSAGDEAVLREAAMISGVSLTAAERMPTAALALEQGLAATREALLDGTIPWSHVEVLVAGAEQVDPKHVARFEAEALRLIGGAGVDQAKDRVRQLVERMDPEPMTDRHQKARAERDVTIEPGGHGMAWLHLYLPAPDGPGALRGPTRTAPVPAAAG